jgi:hypothetical protein
MKTKLLLLLTLLVSLAPLARAQYAVAVVADPIAVANEAEEIAKWTQSIATLEQQLQQMEQTVTLAQQMKAVVGNPASIASSMQLSSLGSAQTVGQLTSTINQAVNGATALENSGSQLFSAVPSTTPGGMTMSFNGDQFKPFAAIQSQNANVTSVIQDTVARIAALQQQKAATLAQIQSAPDQSTVQKLSAQAAAIDGQIASLGQQQQAAAAQIVTQSVSNQNDQKMKAQAANQAADHELNVSLQNFMQWESQISSDRTDYK